MIDELLAPLAPQEPTDDEIRRLLARADRRTRRRRIRIGALTATAAVAVTATLAALPSDPPAPHAPLSAGALLSTTAAVAAEQPSPPAAWTGFRYVEQVVQRESKRFTLQETDRSWTSSDWQGLRLTTGVKLVAGHLPTPEEQRADWLKLIDRMPAAERKRARASLAKAKFTEQTGMLADRRIETPKDMPNLYGDGALAKVPLSELPTDPARLGALLIDAHRDGRWTPGGSWRPLASDVKYDVLRDVLLLLTQANATPAQRAALIAVLRNYEGVTPLERAEDHRGRTGRGVYIPTGRATVRVLFAPKTGELLEWSEPGEVHTYLAFDHVAKLP